jgi:hypothetical protein
MSVAPTKIAPVSLQLSFVTVVTVSDCNNLPPTLALDNIRNYRLRLPQYR